jgi:hypothetical protein
MKNHLVKKCYAECWTDSLEQSRQGKMDMRFGTWNVGVTKNSSNMTQIYWQYKRSDGMRVAVIQQMITFFMEMGMIIIT